MLVPPPDFAILDIGGTEILIIMVIALLLFGSERLPSLARSMGKSLREFKKATSGLEEELRRALETPPPSPRPTGKMTPSPAPPPPAVTSPTTAPTVFTPPPPEDSPYPYSPTPAPPAVAPPTPTSAAVIPPAATPPPSEDSPFP